MRVRTDEEYLTFNPFDEGKGGCSIECRKVLIVTVRKEQLCVAAGLVPPKYEPHNISVGTRAYKESAKVDGQFGSCYSCLPCLDELMRLAYE
jgi:hypothetical protein